MPRTLDIKNSFVTGEISPLLLGRTDLVKYNSACESIENFTVRVQGGLSRRPGLRFINNIPGPGKLIPFIFSSEQSFVLVIVDQEIFFYTKGDFIRDVVSNPYSISAPWLYSDNLELIKFTQIGDVMYLVHPLYPIQKLNRLEDGVWVLNQPNFHAAPATQQDEDISEGVSDIDSFGPVIDPTGGIITATCSRASFIGMSSGTLTRPTDIGATISVPSGGIATILSLQGISVVVTERSSANPGSVETGRMTLYTQAVIEINNSFDANSYTSGNWTISGTPDREPNATLTLSSIQIGLIGDMAITTSIAVFIKGDIGKQIVAGTGIAQIVSLGGGTSTDSNTGATLYTIANVIIIDDFDQPNYVAGSWFLRGGPSSYFSPGVLELVGMEKRWHGSNQFGLGSVIQVRTLNIHPTDYSFQESTGSTYTHILYEGTTIDTFRVSDVGRFVVFSGGYGQITSLGTSSPSNPGDPIPNGSTAATIVILSAPKNTESNAQGSPLIAPAFPGSWFLEDPAFTDVNGYPVSVCFFQSRLFFAGTDANPQTIWGSVIGDFENFAKGTLDDDGIEIVISSGTFDKILWMQPYLGNIITGTNRGEYTVGGGGNADVGQNTTAITPTNATATFQSAYGVTGIQPLIIQESLFYVQRLQLNLYEMEFNIQSASYDSKDMTLLNNLVTKTPFIEMAYQQNQSKIVWFIAANPELTEPGNLVGKNLIGFTFEKGEQVAAWHRHFSGLNGDDDFVSMTVIPNNIDGAIVDELWVMMKRKTEDFEDVYTIELMDIALNVDYARHTISMSPVDQIANVSYLQGEVVSVVADGALLPEMLMDGSGVYAFPPGFTAKDVQIGVNYLSRALTVRPGSSPQGLIKRWNWIWVRVFESLGITVNDQFIPNRTNLDLMGQGVPLFTGDESIINLGYNRDARILIEQRYPLSANILALFGQLEVGEI